jgi:hypothetical protein
LPPRSGQQRQGTGPRFPRAHGPGPGAPGSRTGHGCLAGLSDGDLCACNPRSGAHCRWASRPPGATTHHSCHRQHHTVIVAGISVRRMGGLAEPTGLAHAPAHPPRPSSPTWQAIRARIANNSRTPSRAADNPPAFVYRLVTQIVAGLRSNSVDGQNRPTTVVLACPGPGHRSAVDR